MDMKLIEEGVRKILQGVGEDLNRQGLVDTPARAARMFAELLSSTNKTNDEIASQFSKCFDLNSSEEIVVVSDIPIFSMCEHHVALMYDMRVSVGYRPKGKVIGLSKIARIADAVSHRLQLQERIGTDIAEIIKKVTEAEDVVVIIEGKHACVTARGIKKDSITRTVTKLGNNTHEILECMRF